MATSSERRSISGIRGSAQALTLDKVRDYSRAFATLLRATAGGNTILVGRDTRPNSAGFSACVIESVRGAGWDVIDLGVVPTPTLQIAIPKFKAAGGVVITASHNPVENNGLKFLQGRDGHGMFLTKEAVTELFAIYDQGVFDTRRPGEVHPVAAFSGDFDTPAYTAEFLDRHRIDLPRENLVILDYHLDLVIQAMANELDRIRGMAFRVAMDSCGGAGIPINYVFLDYLYCRLNCVNDRPGVFPRPIEPAPRNLTGLCGELGKNPDPFDVGFVTDCDNDRCVLIAHDPTSGQYHPLAEDYTFAIAVDQVLTASPPGSTVVTNWSTSMMLDDICSSHHANLRRTPTGEVNTATAAHHYHAAVAGEGSCAGVIDPRVGMGRDVLVAIWQVLGSLARRKESLHAIITEMPNYYKAKQNFKSNCTQAEMSGQLQQLQLHYAAKENVQFINREDGVIIYFDDHSRIQVRRSNTEPIIRFSSEARDEALAAKLIKEALDKLGA